VIAKLKGILDTIGDDYLIIDVQGVGYLVYASSRLLSQLPDVGQPLHLLIEAVTRQEQTYLYGFTSHSDQQWFRLLLTVQGVGAKVGLAILSALSGDELTQAIAGQDKTMVTRADGVGPKLAGRIVAELKDKVGTLALPGVSKNLSATIQAASPLQDAISALENLGYRRPEATAAIAQASAQVGQGADMSALIRIALAHLSTSILSKSS
jgi:Holliday junction DNA helicase RuvA